MPSRQQGLVIYPLRELTYVAADGPVDPSDFGDAPLHAQLGDRAPVSVSYSIRFRLRPDAVQPIHERIGPDGIGRLVRDISRRVMLDGLDVPRYDITDTFGENLDALEADLGERMTTALHDAGFEVSMFTILDIDLGQIGELLNQSVLAKTQLEVERANAEVRSFRVANEARLAEQLGFLTDEILRYGRLELAREALGRWDGRIIVNEGGISRLVAHGDGRSPPTGDAAEAAPTTAAQGGGAA